MSYMFFDQTTQAALDARIAGGWTPGTPLLLAGDQLGIITKVIPRYGTDTGVGGHVDFYIPNGVTVMDVGYMVPDGSGGFIKTAMKGQSPIAIGDGPIGAKVTPPLNGLILGPNINGVSQAAVDATTNLDRGTIAGVYGDTGVFYATSPETAWESYAPRNSSLTLTNNSGDVIVPLNKWDAEQLAAFGIKASNNPAYPASPIIDPEDGRGNAPWGLAAGLGGPQSGYKWSFDKDYWDANPADPNRMKNSIEVGPWNRIKYAGSRISYDQPGLKSTVLGYASVDGANIGAVAPLPSTTSQTDSTSPKVIRWAVGQLILDRPEYVWVKVRVDNPGPGFLDANGCPFFHSGTFGGDAGGTDNGKDHLWRYYEPSTFTWNGCLAAGKPSTVEFTKPGDTIQFKVKIYNLGAQAQTNVVVKDTLPSGVTFLSAVPAQGSGPNPLVWNVGTLQPGQSFSAVVSVRVTGTGPLENTLLVTSDQGAQITGDVVGSGTSVYLVPSKTATPTTVAPGGAVTYEILVKNLGLGTTGSPVTLQEYLPTGFTYQSLVSVYVNGALVTGTTVNTTNPNQPLFSVPVAIQGAKQLKLTFTALVGPTVPAGNYCNTYSVTQNSIPTTTGSQGCVDVGAGTIGDTIFRDWNGNGTQDTGEEGIAGATVNLYAGACPPSGSPIQTKTTDANGNYLFGGLNTPASFCVDPVAPSGYTLTTPPDPRTITLALNETNLTADFGYQPGGAGSIGDKVFDDKNNDGVFDGADVGISGVTVNLYEDTNGNGVIDPGDLLVKTTTTNASGNYSFTNLDPTRSYIVDPVDGPGSAVDTYFTNPYLASTTNPNPVSPADFSAQGNAVTDADFGYFGQTPGSIGDQVFIDANGNGIFDAGEQTLANISVNLYQDLNGNGLIDPGEPLIRSTATSITGTYTFADLGPGNYVADVDQTDPDIPAGYATTNDPIFASLAAGQHRTDVDFPLVQLISKQGTPANANPGSTLTYTITTNYPGPDLLSEAVVSDTIPTGTTYLAGSVSGNGVYSPTLNAVLWDLGSNDPAIPGLTAQAGYALCPVMTNIPVVADTWIDKNRPTDNYGGNTLLITRPANTNSLKYTLVRFNTSGIPAGAIIRSATLGINVQTNKNNHFDKVYRLKTSWTEGTLTGNTCSVGATWNAPNCTDNWAGGGAFSAADYDATLLGTISPKSKGYKAADVTAAMTAWVNGGQPNYGLVLLSTGTDSGDAKYYNRENTTANTDPYLRVVYYVQTLGGCSGPTVLTSTADTWVSYGNQTNNYGADTTMLTRPANATNLKHSLLRFDLAGVPADAVISSATLSVTVQSARATDHNDEVRTLLTNWTEGDGTTGSGASWLDADGTGIGDWRGASGLGANTFGSADYGATVYGTLTPSSNNAPETATVTGAVQNWVNSGVANYGFALVSTGTDGGDAKYYTRETGTATQRPTLTVNWTLAPNPAGQTAVRLHAVPLLLGQTGQIKVTMQVTASQSIASLTPPATLNVVADGPTYSLASGPTPAGPVSLTPGTPVYFTYVYNVTPGTTPGAIQFNGKPSASGIQFATSFSEGVIAAPAMRFQVTVNNPAGVTVVNNQADLEDSGALGNGVPSNVTSTSLGASIGDHVWADLDGDGVQDPGEPGLSGVQVCATPTGGGATVCATTDANGNYRIYGLTNGTGYNVTLTPGTIPSGYIPTTPTTLTRAATTAGVNDADFGLQPPGTASIGDTVWLDADNDGVLDAGEAGLPGITVKLYIDQNNNGVVDAGDTLLQTQTTDANGNYLFNGLNPDDYLVVVDTASAVTSPYDGATTIAAAMAPTTGTTNPRDVTITTPGQAITNADFGYNWSGSIGDYVWWDNNYNGIQDESPATPIAGAIALLYFDANGNGIIDQLNGDYQVGFDITDANGLYLFDNLPPGRYLVDVYEDSITTNGIRDIVPTTLNVQSVNLAPNQDLLTVDFGYYVGAKVQGNVFWDENQNAVLDGSEQNPAHLLPNVAVTIVCAGTDGILGTGDDVTQNKNSDANGHYAFIVPPGLCTVSYNTSDPDIPAGLTEQTTPIGYTFVAEGGDDWHPSFDFGVDNPGKIGDTIFVDANGNGVQDSGELGLANVTVNLYNSAGTTLLATTVTDAAGHYLFDGLPNATYQVRVDTATLPTDYAETADPDQPGVHCTTCDNRGTATVSAGGSVLTMDFGYQYQPGGSPTATRTISGLVWDDLDGDGVFDAGEPVFTGVQVTINCGANGVFLATTGALATGRNWSVAGIPNGSNCTITPDPATLPPGYTPTTVITRTVTNVQADVTGQNFGYQQLPSSLSGKVVVGNGNGIADPGEPPLTNVTVTLRYAGADGILGTPDDTLSTTTTNASGAYTFTNLLPGLYQVMETNPVGYTSVADRDFGNPDNITVNLGSNQIVTGRDFEDAAVNGAVTGTVFTDLNGDGTQGPGEAPISGVTVRLYGPGPDGILGTPDDVVVGTTTTNGSGGYTFPNVPAGPYLVRETDPAGYVSTTPNSVPVSVPASGTATANFGDQPTGTISGVVFDDNNGNGVQNPGEPGLGGVTVQLINPTTGAVVATTTTNPDGSYTFTGVTPGAYIVRETDPAGYTSITPNNVPVSVAPGGAANANFGDQQPATVVGTVFNDINGNGVQNVGEPGIAGVTVGLYNSGGTLVSTTTTAADGTYIFTTVAPGAYTVRETDPAGYTSTTANIVPVSVPAGGVGVADFGDQQQGAISGVVFNDANGNGVQDPTEPGLGGVTVQLINPTTGAVVATTVTNPDGSYTFTGVTPGAYIVRETDPSGFASTTPNNVPVSVAPGGATSANFGDQLPATVTGVVFNDLNGNGVQDPGEPGIGGVTVGLYNSGGTLVGATTTAGNGAYLFSNVTPGAYTVRETDPTGYTSTTPNTVPVSVPAGGTANADFGDQLPGTVSGVVFNDANGNGVQDPSEPGIGGVTVQLINPTTGAVVAVTTTAGDGSYTFTGVTPGAYIVRETDPSGFTSTTPNNVPVSVAPGGAANANFGDQLPATVVGTVFNDLNGDGTQDPGENGLGGVTVGLYNSGGTLVATTTTAGNGTYLFANVAPGAYTVRETDPAGYASTTPNTVPVSVPAGGVGVADFGDQQQGTISGVVFNDLNGNGVQDPGEGGLGGVPVQLINPTTGAVVATTVTNPDGSYTFTGVTPGAYIVRETDPSGFASTTPNNVPVILPAGGAANANFGDQLPATVVGTVFNDLNGNGVQDPGEPGIGGVIVGLYNSGGTLVGATTTAGNGAYLFSNVTPGAYTVRETDPAGYVSTTTNTVPVSVPAGGVGVADFGDQLPGTVSGVVFDDANGNGVQDPGESGLGGVTVQLINPTTGAIVATTTTAGDGSYTFTGVTPGAYIVRETDPSGFTSITPNNVPVSVAPGGAANANFGDQLPATVIGTVFNDINGDGAQDPGENGLAGVTVGLYNSGGTLVATTTTAGNGTYLFANVAPGAYTVRETDPAGYTSTTANIVPVSVPAGGVGVADFGDRLSGSVSGVVYGDANSNGVQDPGENGLGGVPVQLIDSTTGLVVATTTTAGDGSYLFTNVPPGSYIVRETDPTGYVSTTPNDVGVSVPAGGSASANFGDNLQGTVAGTVFDDINGNGVQDPGEPGIGGVTVGLYTPGGTLLASTITAGDGTYLFTNVGPGAYSVRETDPSGWSSTTPNSVPVTVPSGGIGHADFGDQLIGSVSGVVFNDINGNGVQDPGEEGIGGVTVQLINPSTGGVIATTTTAADGSYIFTGVTAGAYTVRETDPSGFSSTTPNDVPVSVPAGGAAAANFGDRQIGAVSGVVFNDINSNGSQQFSEPGLAGVTVGLYDSGNNLVATTTTASDGSYLFTNVPTGSYSVRETDPPGFLSTTPNSVAVTVPAGGSASANFGDQIIALGAASLSGVAYLDSNGNGVHDPGETVGIPGAPVTIYGPNAVIITRTTSITGFYSVTNLPPGNYVVQMPATLNSPTAALSSPNQLNATLTSGQHLTGLDFGYVLPTGFTIVSFTAQWQNQAVIVRWVVINEGGLAGYHIYRSTDPNGADLIRITQQMVPVGGGTYQVSDTTAVRGQTYWYWLQLQPDGLLIGPFPLSTASKMYLPAMRKQR